MTIHPQAKRRIAKLALSLLNEADDEINVTRYLEQTPDLFTFIDSRIVHKRHLCGDVVILAILSYLQHHPDQRESIADLIDWLIKYQKIYAPHEYKAPENVGHARPLFKIHEIRQRIKYRKAKPSLEKSPRLDQYCLPEIYRELWIYVDCFVQCSAEFKPLLADENTPYELPKPLEPIKPLAEALGISRAEIIEPEPEPEPITAPVATLEPEPNPAPVNLSELFSPPLRPEISKQIKGDRTLASTWADLAASYITYLNDKDANTFGLDPILVGQILADMFGKSLSDQQLILKYRSLPTHAYSGIRYSLTTR